MLPDVSTTKKIQVLVRVEKGQPRPTKEKIEELYRNGAFHQIPLFADVSGDLPHQVLDDIVPYTLEVLDE